MLVSQNNETAAILVPKPVLWELCKKLFFSSNKFAYLLATWVKRLYISFLFKTVLAQPYGENEYIVYAQYSRPQLSQEKVCSTDVQTKRFMYMLFYS